ncbi:PTPRK [Mytilus coruscus]|uniref:protein-tyrosine-phosphatase n=1 Tax=Mytilus coruscus TaxID=42192 RepID=A0A6J8CTT4_MYTCO|nr:PTPRK [Mytilus coruscus]
MMYFKVIITVQIVCFSQSIAFPNLAVNGTATQSGSYKDAKGIVYDASKALDGNIDQSWNGGSCSHTAVEQSSAWWRLDLGSSAYIYKIIIYYRNSKNDRLNGYYLYIANSSSRTHPISGHLCYHHPLHSSIPDTIQDKVCNMSGRYVEFYNKRDEPEAFVELCEVKVFGCFVGQYGSQCELSCSPNCNDVTCSIWDGSCTSCKAGFNGKHCNEACPSGFYGENCLEQCGSCKDSYCDKFNGNCQYGCSDGWHGQKCDQECQFNYHGENCAHKCGNCKSLGCDRFSGICSNNECSAGWKGQRCNMLCDRGTYGITCRNTCNTCKNAVCNRFNGSCTNGCSDGWTGSMCKKICDRGTYGKNCRNTCKTCKNSVCNRFNGSCTYGCSNGWIGSMCKKRCSASTYGENCQFKCHCLNGKTCNNVNGNCPEGLCDPGWKSKTCNQTCGTGYYGINCSMACRNCINESCDPLRGICKSVGSCKAGYYGPKCNKACKSPLFGNNCQQTCHCVNETLCNNVNGQCELDSCDRGWMGTSCAQPCSPGRFGHNCAETCTGCLDEDCEQISGNCTKNGCRDDYTGYRCHLRGTVPLKNDKAQPTIIGGVIGAILAVFAIIVVGILIYRKRANGPRKPTRGTQIPNDVKEVCNPGYSKETFESPQYAHVEKENQMPFKGLNDCREDSVEFGNVSTNDNVYANGPRPDNLHSNTESKDAENLYSNTETKNVFSEYNISVGNLPNIAKIKRKHNAFKKEYSMLPMGSTLPHLEGEREENRKKNRFLTTFPYDHSRVKLETYNNSTDYINANYIKSYSKDKAYIATQGPKKITLSDFWQMIWQENVDRIIMVTKLVEGEKKKCEQYWPESTHKLVLIGKFTIKMLEEAENTVYTYRCIQLSCENTDRTVHHFHFTKWPDHDVPDKTHLVNFYRKVKSRPTNGSGPMVVHCSAGIGRTGTFLALDALYEHGKTTGFVNIMEYTHMMRQDRMNMIQTVEQYATVYDVLVEAFTVPQSAIPRQDFLNILDSRLIEREYQKLQDLKPTIEVNEFQAGKRKENVSKNAIQNILPNDNYRPYLMSYGRSSNDYINAVKIPSFIEGRNVFVTQYPLQNTIGDLWSLIYDNDCRTMVILEKLDEDVPVIPRDTDQRFSNDNFIISRNSSNVLQDKVKVSLRHKNKKEERPLTVFIYNEWEDNNTMPNSTKTMVDFIENVARTTREDNESIVVICRDGCTKSGIFVTLDLVLEKMETDEEIDIFQVARRIQIRRPQFLSSIEQYEFCYSAVKELLSSESVYANA